MTQTVGGTLAQRGDHKVEPAGGALQSMTVAVVAQC
jgi:hypothetical protein